jgi:hypothetical protein
VNIFHPEHKAVVGFALNVVYGETDLVYGLNVNAVAGESGAVYGIELGLLDAAKRFGGLQVNGILGHAGERFDGIQITGIYGGNGGTFRGIQLSGIVASIADGRPALQTGLLLNRADSLVGSQIGLYNNVNHNFTGLQVALTVNADNQTLGWSGGSNCIGAGCIVAPEEFEANSTRGVLFAGILNRAQKFAGAAIGGVANSVGHDGAGLMLASLYNGTDDFSGFELAVLNLARDVRGIQIGAVNVARRLHGLQIGAVNVAYQNPIPFLPVINAGW